MCSQDELKMRKICDIPVSRERRRKRDRVGMYTIVQVSQKSSKTTLNSKKKSMSLQRHQGSMETGGILALLPSLAGVFVLVCALLAKRGFRGRATTAGIDLGTTNSVVCVQSPSKSVGDITCIVDPNSNSSIIPSVISFLEPSERPPVFVKSKSKLVLPPSHVVVGQAAKKRIDSHPHQTLYHAKRLLGRRGVDQVLKSMQEEVDFEIVANDDDTIGMVVSHDHTLLSLSPSQVGSYVVNYMMEITHRFLGHENVKSAVICVPAKFDANQRKETVRAFTDAGIKVTRILEEPAAAALAYGLHKKEGVEFILVYDFGGGTLDVSLLHVTEGFADVMGSDGDNRLGGADFDDAIAKLLQRQINVNQVPNALKELYSVDLDLEAELEKTCPILSVTPLCTLSSLHTISEKLKIKLSSDEKRVESSCLTTTLNSKPNSLDHFCSSLQSVSIVLTRDQFHEAVQPLFERAVLPIRKLLKDLTLEPKDIHEVVMVGGTTRMPQIRELVKKEMQTESLNTHIDPDITVAYGAASVID
jgi:molecular chaperone DnaK (HSP70)